MATKSRILEIGLFALMLVASGCGSGGGGGGGSGNGNALDQSEGPEVTPEETARQLGVPNEPGPRTVKESDYGKYPLVVDVFRWSPTNPVLGAFDPRYVDLLVPPGGSETDRLAKAQTLFKTLAGKEFAVISVDGAVRKAEIISGAIEAYAEGGFRSTPPGSYKLDVIRYMKKIPADGGATRSAAVDYPWLRSERFGNSIMYWGLWIFGGYFIHSTTHYGHLGERASMGCVRQSYPDAIELFKLRQTHLGMIRIHKIGSDEALRRFHEITTVEATLARLAANLKNIQAYMDYANASEIYVQGHAWVDPATGKPGPVDWPNCGPVDCFTVWGRKMPGFTSSFGPGELAAAF